MTYPKASNTRRSKVFSKTKGKCYYCGFALCFETFHIDHIEPTSRGGVNLHSNLAPACPSCNTSKGAKTLEEWRLVRGFREQHPDAPDMSLRQIQWMTDCKYTTVLPHVFYFEVCNGH
jgi:5-methylcytosine-specific restriction endonuclease McrA